MENRLDFGMRSVERERWRWRGWLPAGADKLSCDTMATWHREERTPAARSDQVRLGRVGLADATSRSVPRSDKRVAVRCTCARTHPS